MARRTTKKTAFVPRILVRAATVASVVPACAMACSTGGSGGLTDAGSETAVPPGVAAVAYPAYEAGVKDTGARDAAPEVADVNTPEIDLPPPGVAAVAYPAYEAGAD